MAQRNAQRNLAIAMRSDCVMIGSPSRQAGLFMSWKKLDSTVIYENPWMTVLEDRVINPGGGENQYGHVHFKNKAAAERGARNDRTRRDYRRHYLRGTHAGR